MGTKHFRTSVYEWFVKFQDNTQIAHDIIRISYTHTVSIRHVT